MPAVYPSEEFFEKYNVRTDLALEAREVIVEHEGPPEIPGVIVQDEKTENAQISRMTIETDEGARIMGKAKGHYSTILANGLRQRDKIVQDEIAEIMLKELDAFLERLQVGPEDTILVVGLGNWNATPDALGPKVISKLLVTRHLYQTSPPELRNGLRPVAAIAPGVLGLTGIETGEIIQGVVSKIRPKVIICIDALAARSTERLCTTIQIADTGIHPGSGIGNKRLGITQETMGVPVIAVGVPTVVHAITIVSDGMDLLAQQNALGNAQMGQPTAAMQPGTAVQASQSGAAGTPNLSVQRNPAQAGAGQQGVPEATGGPTRFNLNAFNLLHSDSGTRTAASGPVTAGKKGMETAQSPGAQFVRPRLDPALKRELIQQILTPYMGTMVVTPKEIDVLIEDAAHVVAAGLNGVFHPGIDESELNFYTR